MCSAGDTRDKLSRAFNAYNFTASDSVFSGAPEFFDTGSEYIVSFQAASQSRVICGRLCEMLARNGSRRCALYLEQIRLLREHIEGRCSPFGNLNIYVNV